MAFLGFLSSLFGFGCKPPTTAPAAPSPQAKAMAELRTMMLATSPSQAGIQPTEKFPKVFGIVMDISMTDNLTASVVAMCDGHASLYTTAQFGVMGGIGHEPVRIAATNFVGLAQEHYETAQPVTEFPYPGTDHVRFYLLGFNGVRAIDTTIGSVENRTDKCSDIWLAGQQVLTGLRLITEKK